jgi:hypothetical protein
MRVIVFFLIILIVAGYVGSEITQVKNPYVVYYTTWAFGLIFTNVLIGLFLYAFRHSIIDSSGQPGLKGKMGRRGEEGEPGFCNFCLKEDKLNESNKFYMEKYDVKVAAEVKRLAEVAAKVAAEKAAAAAEAKVAAEKAEKMLKDVTKAYPDHVDITISILTSLFMHHDLDPDGWDKLTSDEQTIKFEEYSSYLES